MTQTAEIRQYAFRNDSGHTVPPYGVMSVTDTIEEQNEIIYLIRRPTIDDQEAQDPAWLVFNLGEYVANGDKGRCTSAMPAQALCKSDVVLHESVGPVTDSFVLERYGAAFVTKCRDNTNPHEEGTAVAWMVEIDVTASISGKTQGSPLVVGTPGNVLIYDSVGVITTREYKAFTRGSDIDATTEIEIFRHGSGKWLALKVC